jgi:hypothetical protein
MKRLVVIAVVLLVAWPATAQTTFSVPEEVAAASVYHCGFVAAADAAGRVSVATRAASRV